MVSPTIPVSTEENLRDPIDIRVDISHPKPVAVVAFPTAAVVRTQAQHGEAIRGIPFTRGTQRGGDEYFEVQDGYGQSRECLSAWVEKSPVKGPTAEDEDPAIGDEGLAFGDQSPGTRVKSLGLGGDAAVPKAPPVQTSPSPEWSSGLLPVSPAHSIVPLPVSSPMIPLTILSPVASPTTAETEGFLTELVPKLRYGED
uniref:Uncharacterized protein n=1 Tax=Tanacetum cinerariifolium TaxID=118510 RepID=A0A6L2LQ31_TANCI|nr:hypothetical protein [Tanacetum cinerariifolium]